MKEKFKIGDSVRLKEEYRFSDDYPGTGVIVNIANGTHGFDIMYFVKWQYLKNAVSFEEDDLYLYEGYEDFEDKIKDRTT